MMARAAAAAAQNGAQMPPSNASAYSSFGLPGGGGVGMFPELAMLQNYGQLLPGFANMIDPKANGSDAVARELRGEGTGRAGGGRTRSSDSRTSSAYASRHQAAGGPPRPGATGVSPGAPRGASARAHRAGGACRRERRRIRCARPPMPAGRCRAGAPGCSRERWDGAARRYGASVSDAAPRSRRSPAAAAAAGRRQAQAPPHPQAARWRLRPWPPLSRRRRLPLPPPPPQSSGAATASTSAWSCCASWCRTQSAPTRPASWRRCAAHAAALAAPQTARAAAALLSSQHHRPRVPPPRC